MITTIILSYAKTRCFMNSLESDISLQKCVAFHHKFIHLALWAKTLQKCFILEVILCNTTVALVVVSGIAFWVMWISQKEPVSWGPSLNTLTACQSYRHHQNNLFPSVGGNCPLGKLTGEREYKAEQLKMVDCASSWPKVVFPSPSTEFSASPLQREAGRPVDTCN